jgi:biotin transport system substrate-specific component
LLLTEKSHLSYNPPEQGNPLGERKEISRSVMTRASSDVLIDRVFINRSIATDAMWIIAFSLVTAALAQISIHVPGVPVPITGQTFAVLLSGAVLGWRRGLLSQVAYLAEGAAGLPVFADGAGSALHLVGPSGGYLLCFPLAAALVGYLVEQGAGHSTWKMAGALVSGDVMILGAGSTWLHFVFRVPYSQAWLLGFYPFLIADVVKVVLVGCTWPRLLRRIEASIDAPSD